MRARRGLGIALAAAVALAGCGGLVEPTVGSDEEVLDAVLALREGASARATLEVALDEDELRGVLRDDDEARALVQELARLETDDLDEVLATLTDLQDELADHAVLLETAADGSRRLAATYRDAVWLDLRARPGAAPPDEPARIDLQARVDWATAGALLERPGLLEELEEVTSALLPFIGALPDGDAVEDAVLGLLAGELVGVRGPVDEALLDGLGGGWPAGALDAARSALDPDPREVLTRGLSFDGYRADGADTLVDVTVELRAVGELLLERAAAAGDDATAAELEAAQERLTDLPPRLTDVAVLRLGPDGALQEVRVDVLDVMLQTARTVDGDDVDAARLATVQRLVGALDDTGIVVVVDVDRDPGRLTVLDDAAVTVRPEQAAAALRAVLFGGLASGLWDLADLGPAARDDSTD